MATSRPGAQAPATATDGLIDALAQAAFAVMAVLHQVAAAHDLSLTQLRVLGILRDRRLRMSQLAGHLGLERSTLSGLVDRAEARGLIARVASDDDRRAVEVTLSRAGQEQAGRLAAEVRRALAPLTDALNDGERARLRVLLERMLGGPGPGLAPGSGAAA
ncbi:MAG TPA: MarR family transcriptional regulator, partial [Kofleriaceae bacterium]|nr:MarR family transcriptional regulator [Kofleriaceae bacterium]